MLAMRRYLRELRKGHGLPRPRRAAVRDAVRGRDRAGGGDGALPGADDYAAGADLDQVHRCRLAQALGIPRVILPAAAGVTAPLGLLAAELRFDVARTHVRRLDDVDPVVVDRVYAEMEAQAAEVVRGTAGAGEVAVRRSADCRYVWQGYELSVPVPAGPLGRAAIEQVRRAFDEAYAQRCGYASPGEAVQAVTWKLAAVGAGPGLALPRIAGRVAPETARTDRRPVYFPEQGGYADTPVRDLLSPDAELAGPAVIEERESTTVLPPGCAARVDEYGSLLVEVPGANVAR